MTTHKCLPESIAGCHRFRQTIGSSAKMLKLKLLKATFDAGNFCSRSLAD